MDVDGLIDGYRFEYDNNAFESLDLKDVIYLTTNDEYGYRRNNKIIVHY